MSRYKGRTSFKIIERKNPHFVEVIVPPGDLGKRLDAMYEFQTRHGIEAHHGRGRRNENDRDHIRWCFDDLPLAAAFAEEFA